MVLGEQTFEHDLIPGKHNDDYNAKALAIGKTSLLEVLAPLQIHTDIDNLTANFCIVRFLMCNLIVSVKY